MSMLLHVRYAIGKIGYCDFTPAYVSKMTSEETLNQKFLMLNVPWVVKL